MVKKLDLRWLDKHIKEQEGQRKKMGKNIAKLQEIAEFENFDRPKRRKK